VAGVRRKAVVGGNGDTVQMAAGIFREYGGFIRAIIRYQVHNKLDEEDLFQEFFLALVHKPVPADVREIKGYLYRAVVSHVVDSVRARGNYHRAVKKYVKENENFINNCPPRNAFIEDEERDATIAHYARHLPEREAQVFVLKYRDNCSNGEIAAKLGVDARTVSRYLSTSLGKVRRMLATQ